MPGIATSRIRQLVSLTASDARNASADENAWAANPNCRSKSGNDSRTDSSSSTTDTSDRLLITMRMRHLAGDRPLALGFAADSSSGSTAPARASRRLKRKGEREGGAWSIVRLGPKTPVMPLDNRAADKQPDAHTAALRRVEGFE